MRTLGTIDATGLLHVLTRDFASLLMGTLDPDETPTFDAFRGFRDPGEQLRHERAERSNAPEPFEYPI